jgi:hypothetical protein
MQYNRELYVEAPRPAAGLAQPPQQRGGEGAFTVHPRLHREESSARVEGEFPGFDGVHEAIDWERSAAFLQVLQRKLYRVGPNCGPTLRLY